MHLIKHRDGVGVGGVGRIVGVNFWPEIKGAIAHLERQNLRQVADIDPEEVRRILLSVCPCWEMEHRLGVCPLGLTHRIEDHGAKNAVTRYYTKSIIDQMVGNASPTSLLITRIATGTSSDDTDITEDALFAETYRDTLTALDDTSDTTCEAYWFFGPLRANAGVQLQEWGIMAGGAGDLPGSPGIMIARFLDPFNKNIGTAANGNYSFALA